MNGSTRTLMVTWIAASFASYILAEVVSLLVVATIVGQFPGTEAGTFGHGLVLAVHVALWSALAGFAVFFLAVALFRRRPKVSRLAIGLAVALALMAAWAQLSQHEWARSQFGVYDPEYVGAAGLLVPALVFASMSAVIAGIVFESYNREPGR